MEGTTKTEDRKITKRVKFEIIFTSVLFLLWLLFFDSDNFIKQREDQHKLNQLTEQRDYLKQKIKADKQKIEELKTDNKNLEKFAREEFLMKKENEDIFIIKEEE